MTSRALTSRLVSELQQALAVFSPKRAQTDKQQLSALAKEVLASIDVRDLRGISADALVPQLEELLAVLEQRRKDEIKVRLHHDPAREVLVLRTCVEDQPFLVSTVRAALAAERLEVRSFLNAIVRVRRDPSGRLVQVGSGAGESTMRVEVVHRPHGDAAAIPEGLADRIEKRLAQTQAMVRDFDAMKTSIGQAADRYFAAAAAEQGHTFTLLRETEDLLRWLCNGHYVLLSVERYDRDGELREALGQSRLARPTRSREVLATAARGEGRLCRFERSKDESPVHRTGKPGHFFVTELDAEGQPSGCLVIDGLFTYDALRMPLEQVPVIRLALQDMLTDRQVPRASARGKAITNAFNSLPLEYLLSQDRESIWELTDRILRAEAEGESDVHIRVGDGSRFAFVVVALPRSQFSEELRREVQALVVRELGATYADYGIYIDRYDNAVVHYYVTGAGPLRTVDTESLRERVLALARGWNERLHEAVAALAEGPDVQELVAIYEHAFTEEHKRRCSTSRITSDIRSLERLRAGAEIDCDLYVSEFGDYPGSLNLRLFARNALSLSQELPVITNFGFEVIDEFSREVKLPRLPPVDMDNFRFEVRADRIGQIMSRRREIAHALVEVFAGRAGDDDLNRLIVHSSLGVNEVDVLRGYIAYLHQLQVPFAPAVLRATLVEHRSVAEAMIAWLAARFDPKVASEALAASTEAALSQELRVVTDYTADRVLAAVAEVVRATRRTNAYVLDRERGDALAFKIAAGELSFGPSPKPYREIWVYHRDFQGVHMRGGRVARGGIRFSDRPDDFRTEIHGLMATQMVKNVLIVPMGAKGGFVLRNPPAERDALRAAGDQYYRRFVTALLDLTDNIVDGQAQRPEGILVDREQTDPYLVVAADKGTAHLSDTANAISQERGFWLDDAFASGGSHGYDHKQTGITARGAWEVSKRSFRELGIDPEQDVITVVGVGDMSGDVFGNGLLRSRSVKLVAAFNHQHIFVDPDPDPERSFAERKRLFELPRSSWADYDASVLSKGGGVYPRRSKVVELSPEARERLGIPGTHELGGDEVIRAILRAPVDLIWMGGIGTYVKSRDETHAEVGDKANDGARVDAYELRCRVIAEGANLAITDRGRVAFARGGGHNYNAFLDNSGGVDTSDHEVNIKILFAPLLRNGTITREARNHALEQCEPDIVERVLGNNRAQSRMVSFDVRRSRRDVHRYARALRYLAEAVPFDPERFALPSEEELSSRARKGLGLYKTEAAVLCSHAKMLAYRELLECPRLPDRIIDAALADYFPPAIRELAGEAELRGHLLRREIATTVLVNRIIDNAGGSMLAEIVLATGKSTRDVVLAHLHALEAGDVLALLDELYTYEDKHRQEAVYEIMIGIENALEEATFYLLDQFALPEVDDTTIEQTRSLLANVEDALPSASRGRMAARVERLRDLGIDPGFAARIVKLRYLTPVIDAARLAPTLGRAPVEILRLRFAVPDKMNFLHLHQAIDRVVYATPWDGPAISALRRQLNFHLYKLVRLVEGDDVDGMLDRFGLRGFIRRVHEEAESGPTISGLVMLDDWLRRSLPSVAALERLRVK